jgi:hypothetical protein
LLANQEGEEGCPDLLPTDDNDDRIYIELDSEYGFFINKL